MKRPDFKRHTAPPTLRSAASKAAGALGVAAIVACMGCPIKFWTGISCPGCGMTRAWLSAFALRFDLALAYHPLFWAAPPLFIVVLLRNRMPRPVFIVITLVAIGAFVVVWGIRYAIPREANVLFSELLEEKVVTIDTPEWIVWLRALVDYVAHGMGGP